MANLPNTWATGNSYTAAAANAVADAVNGLNLSGVFASLPAAGFAGRTYDCTDNGNRYRDNGTTWDLISIGGSGLAGTAPAATGWSTTTLGTATVAADKGGYLMTGPTVNGGDLLRVHYRSLSPASNYTATFCLDWLVAPYNNCSALIAVGDGTKWIEWGIQFTNTAWQVCVIQHTNASTYSSTPFIWAGANSSQYLTARWWRIRDDGTNHNFEVSLNGLEWLKLYSQGRTAFLTPSVIGWGLNVSSTTVSTSYARLRSLTGVA